jgi:hypothetical protein
VVQAAVVERMAKRTHHVFLPDHRVECRGPEFARQNLITHDPALY